MAHVFFNNVSTESLNLTNNFFTDLICNNNLISDHLKLVMESKQAYDSIVEQYNTGERIPDGLVETDSESDDPEDWLKIDANNQENEELQKKN